MDDQLPAGVDIPTPSAETSTAEAEERLAKLALEEGDGGDKPADDDEPALEEGEDADKEPAAEDEPASDEEPPEVAELRTQVTELEEKLQAHEAREQDWRSSSLETLVQNRHLADTIDMLEQYLAANGIAVDAKDLEILSLRKDGYARAIEGTVKEKATKTSSEAAISTRVAEMKAGLTKAAAAHRLPVDIITARWNQLCDKAGKTVSFDEAAKSVNADLKRGLTSKQVAANSAVKPPLKTKGGGSSSRPTFAPPTTEEGIRQRLAAANHDLS